MITVVSVGDRICSGTYALQACFKRSTHFCRQNNFVFIVDDRIGAGPLNVVITGGNPGAIKSLIINNHSMVIDGETVSYDESCLYNSGIGQLPNSNLNIQESLAVLEKSLLDGAHSMSLAFLVDASRDSFFDDRFGQEFVKRIRSGVQKMCVGNLAEGAPEIRGCGFGLTPSGDDFLAGVMIALTFSQKINRQSSAEQIETIFKAVGVGDRLSDSFLLLARDGRVDESMKRLISALVAGDSIQICKDMKSVLNHGASSGADFITGFLIALRWQTN
jgi:hypothetical protein